MNDHTTISISTGTIIKAVLIGVAFYALFVLKDIVLLILSAIVIASVIEPYTKWISARGLPRVVSVIAVYLGIIILLSIFFYFIIPPLISETVSLLNEVPQYIKTIDILNPIHQGTYNSVKSIFPSLPSTINVVDIITAIVSALSGLSGDLFDTVTSIFGGIFGVILVVVVSFYLAVREDGVAEFLRIVSPLKHERYIISIWKRAQIKIGRWMQGQLMLGVIVGILIYLGLLILHVQHPVLLAFLAALFELIPVVGMTLAGIPAFLFGVLDGGITLGLLIIGLYFIVQQFEAHLIYPLVVKKIVGVPPLVVIIALICGAKLGGFIGILLSVPISVALIEYIDDVEKRKRFPENVDETKM